jgi:pimeloyl-ACP methyl ester carboxylesterase
MGNTLVDGIETYYELPRGYPRDRGQVLTLFLHGAGGSSQHWGPCLACLSECVRPLLVDLPGLGRSSGTVLATVGDAVRFLERLLAQLGVAPPINCVGHSLGGLIAQQFALSAPSRVSRLVLIATAPRIRPHPDFLRAALTGSWELDVLRASFGSGTPREVQDLVLNELPKTRLAEGATGFMDEPDLREQVGALSAIPTLIVAGDDDIIISPRHSRSLHQKIAGSKLLIVPGGGHYVQAEQPELVAGAIDQFLCAT